MARKDKLREVDFEQTLTNLAGLPLKLDNQVATLKMVAISALVGSFTDENPTGTEKAGRYRLAERIYGGLKNLTGEEIETIKLVVGKAYGPIIVGPVYSLLETSVAA